MPETNDQSIPFPSERFIEDYLWEKLEKYGRFAIDGSNYIDFMRQVDLGAYGIADLVLFDACDEYTYITVVELKNIELAAKDLQQLGRYMKAMREFVEPISEKSRRIQVSGILAGPFNPRESGLIWLLPFLQDINIYALSVDMDHGFMAEEIEPWWSIASERKGAADEILETCQRIKRVFAAQENVVAIGHQKQ